MNCFAVVLIMTFVAWIPSECKFYRRLESGQSEETPRATFDLLRRRRDAQLRSVQKRANDDIREPIFGGRGVPYSDNSQAESRSDYSFSHRNRKPYTSSVPSYRRASLPDNSRFCPGSDEYYCDVSAECVRDEITNAWKCRYSQRHTVRRRPVATHQEEDDGRYRYYSHSRRPPGTHSSGSYFPSHVTQTTYRCGAGLKRVNITSRAFRCDDIDECEPEANVCEGICKNTFGSFYCSCNRGFVRNGKYGCRDRDECADIRGICGIATCINTNGGYNCMCPDGYIKQGKRHCKDINECEELDPCLEEQICFNKWGDYSCDEPTECEGGYARSVTSDDPNSNCILQNRTSTSAYQPTSISYRKILVEARKYPDSSRTLATMRFSSPDSRFYHRYSVRILEGNQNFWYRQRSTSYPNNLFMIDLYNRQPLNPGQEYPLSLVVTDAPSRRAENRYRSYGSYNYERLPASRRKMVITIVPQVHGSESF